jgi:hypothetical protein
MLLNAVTGAARLRVSSADANSGLAIEPPRHPINASLTGHHAWLYDVGTMSASRNTGIVERVTPEEFVRRMLEIREQQEAARRRERSSAEKRRELDFGRRLTLRITGQLVLYLQEMGWVVRREVYLRRGSGCIQSRRIDIVAERSIAGVDLSCSFEVKVVRDDFCYERRHPEKSLPARRITDQYYFVAPSSTINDREVPRWAGFVSWADGAFRIVKEAPRTKRGRARNIMQI